MRRTSATLLRSSAIVSKRCVSSGSNYLFRARSTYSSFVVPTTRISPYVFRSNFCTQTVKSTPDEAAFVKAWAKSQSNYLSLFGFNRFAVIFGALFGAGTYVAVSRQHEIANKMNTMLKESPGDYNKYASFVRNITSTYNLIERYSTSTIIVQLICISLLASVWARCRTSRAFSRFLDTGREAVSIQFSEKMRKSVLSSSGIRAAFLAPLLALPGLLFAGFSESWINQLRTTKTPVEDFVSATTKMANSITFAAVLLPIYFGVILSFQPYIILPVFFGSAVGSAIKI